MNKIDKLQTAIRRYCIDNHYFWWNKYFELDTANRLHNSSGYTDEEYSVFPRYNVLKAILTEIEKVQPADFSNF